MAIKEIFDYFNISWEGSQVSAFDNKTVLK